MSKKIISSKGNKLYTIDNREFIDQGEWIISTVHRYLSFTNDYSLLKEKCGYCELIGRKAGEKLNIEETVYDHLVRIIKYLISNIDEDTGCLKALYGDWNDAVDGLGLSDTDKFGNGVSIMASCHLYQNLHEMEDISNIYKDKEDPKYIDIASKLEKSILKNGVTIKNGEKTLSITEELVLGITMNDSVVVAEPAADQYTALN